MRARDEPPTPAEQVKLVTATRLARSFGARTVLEGVEFALEAGERLAVTGPNGSGKTTLLRCLAGLLAPSAGEVTICGLAPTDTRARARLGAVIGDHRSFYLRLTAQQNLILFARLKDGRWRVAAEADAIEAELGLEEIRDRPVARCSSGQVQRLALARALIGRPAALLLDEPTRSMDAHSSELAWAAIDRRPELAVVLVTHDREEALRCGRSLALGDRPAATD